MARKLVESPNVEFLLKEQWEIDCWDPSQCQIVNLSGGGYGLLDNSIQTLVASSDSRYWLNEWWRAQEGRPLEEADMDEWIEDATEELTRLKGEFGLDS